MTLHLVTAQAINPDEARARLQALPPQMMKAARLAREWGWSRSKVRRFIAACRAKGVIPAAAGAAGGGGKRKPAPAATVPTDGGGRSHGAETKKSGKPQPRGDAPMTSRQELQLSSMPPPFEPPADMADETHPAPEPPMRQRDGTQPPPRTPFGDKLLALILGVVAIVLGGIGLILNVTFAQTFGPPGTIVGSVLAVLFGMIDVLTIILPTVARNLSEQKLTGPAFIAWACWGGVLMMTLIAASSFTATNIGDTFEGRDKVTRERAGLTVTLEQLRHDRSAINEPRAPAAIQALIQKEEPRIPAANWKSSVGCTVVTSSGRVCEKINTLRQAKADAERRDVLEANIKAAAASLKNLPAYASADPGAEMAAKIFTTASLGLVRVQPETIQQIRIAGLTIAPAAGGLLLMFAGLTWRLRREPEPIGPLV